jgi:outer membrane lipoprotein-sorting protein
VSFLRTISTPRLAALCASACAVAAGGTAIALAGEDGPKPPPKPLATAVHDGLKAPEVDGVTARVKFTNHLLDTAGIYGNPLLTGATGRLWLSPGKGLRLELQSDDGDAQIVANKDGFWVYDGEENVVYRGDAPKGHKRRAHRRHKHKIPSVARIQRGLDRANKHKLDISGPVPGNIAGQPAYTVRVAPGRPGGLLGAVELAWDAARGLPLKVGVYARGNDDPVLELIATEVEYGPVAASTFDIDPPADARVEDLTMRGGHRGRHAKRRAIRRLGFQVSAPATLAGRKRSGIKKVRIGKEKAALIRYGKDLDAILVVQKRAKADTGRQERRGHHNELPTADINGASATVLDTPLGSVVTFERNGVSYTVLGSVPAEVTKTAASGL